MIEILSQSTDTCLVVQATGKVSGQDYKIFLDALEPRMKTQSEIDLVMTFKDFEFYEDVEAAGEDFKFGVGEYKYIRKAAFVGNQKWIDWFTRFVGPFTKTEEKHFPEGQLDEAVRWASA